MPDSKQSLGKQRNFERWEPIGREFGLDQRWLVMGTAVLSCHPWEASEMHRWPEPLRATLGLVAEAPFMFSVRKQRNSPSQVEASKSPGAEYRSQGSYHKDTHKKPPTPQFVETARYLWEPVGGTTAMSTTFTRSFPALNLNKPDDAFLSAGILRKEALKLSTSQPFQSIWLESTATGLRCRGIGNQWNPRTSASAAGPWPP